MLWYVVCFIAGGYIVPASLHMHGIYRTDRKAPDNPTVGDSLITAIIGGLLWPLMDGEYIPFE